MKFILAVLVSLSISLSASAQWWNISLKKHARYPALPEPHNNSIKNLPGISFSKATLPKFNFTQSDYNIELTEAAIMKVAQHNMRFRVYYVASYNFSDLAKLYIKQNRFSEAMWFLLQSNNISRQQNDDRHTIANLMDLAMVKANMGDPLHAQQDLAEAQQLATARGLTANLVDIQKEQKFVQQYKPLLTKAEWRYASDAMITSDKKAD